MPVYVDNGKWPYGRMIMSHMLADDINELHDMARKLGLMRRWFQDGPRKTPHYDICQKKRALAIQLGALVADKRKVVELRNHWRAIKADVNNCAYCYKKLDEIELIPGTVSRFCGLLCSNLYKREQKKGL